MTERMSVLDLWENPKQWRTVSEVTAELVRRYPNLRSVKKAERFLLYRPWWVRNLLPKGLFEWSIGYKLARWKRRDRPECLVGRFVKMIRPKYEYLCNGLYEQRYKEVWEREMP